MGIDILGIDIMGVDILGIYILALPPSNDIFSRFIGEQYITIQKQWIVAPYCLFFLQYL